MPLKKTKRVTLADIAEEAGVSTALVSNILNGKGRASEEVRNRIQDLLEFHGFKPKYQQKPLLFITSSPLTNNEIWFQEQFTALLSGISQASSKASINLQVHFVGPEEDYVMPSEPKDRPSAIIATTGSVDMVNLDKTCKENKVPLIQVGYDNEIFQCGAVVSDSYAAVYKATLALFQEGHSRIGLVRWKSTSLNSNKKLAGYRTAVESCGIEYDESLVVDAVHSIAELDDPKMQRPAREALEELLKVDNPPTAVIIDNSFISSSVIYPLPGDHGELPEHIAKLDMIHIEDISLSAVKAIVSGMICFDLAETKVMRIDWVQIGRLAAECIIHTLTEGNLTDLSKTLKVEPELKIIEES
ncbi:MAG: LacI family transcriptional regulator [Lentisphaeria bacterium]|nr:LacI family transcriptional regulator [Lentisphaeria bacterium]